MHLKRLEIQGFKSFAGKTVLEFLPPKEGRNSVTAIVGPNGSGKSNIADAIRWAMGEQSLKALRGKRNEDVIFNGSETKSQLGAAEVSLVLDNADGQILGDFPEIIVSRRMYRSGEGECFINHQPARLFDIHLLLAKAQFAEGSYGVVGQGMIDRMLVSSPAERKEFIDEAAGIKEFQLKRHQAALKLERTGENMSQAERLLNEVEPRLRLLSRQVKKLERRQAVETELREAQEIYYSSLYHRNKLEADEINASLASAEKNFQAARAELEKIQLELGDLARAAGRPEVFADLQNRYQAALHAKNELERALAVIDGRRQIKYSERGRQDVGWLEGKIKELKFERESAGRELKILEESGRKSGEILVARQKELDLLSGEKSERMVKISRLQSRLLDGQSEKNFWQASGYSAVRAVLDSGGRWGKIYGAVSTLGEAEESYRLALDAAAGSRLFSIVVDNEETASRAIEYLREKRLGVATFMPLDKIRGRDATPETGLPLKEDGVLGRAIDLLRFEEKFRDVFSFIFGDTLVVRDLRVASRLGIGRWRMVTLDGDLCDRYGVMRGGWRGARAGWSFASKTAWSAEDRIKESQEELLEEQRAMSALEEKIEAARKAFGQAEIERQANQAKLEMRAAGVGEKDKEVAALERELSMTKVGPEEFGEELSRLNEEREKTEKEIAAASAKSDELARQIQEFNRREEDKKQRVFALQAEMQGAQETMNRVSAERNDWRVALAKIETRQEALSAEVGADLNTTVASIVERGLPPVPVQELEGLAGRIQKLKYQLSLIGGIDEEVVKEYGLTKERYDFLSGQLRDLRRATEDLKKMVADLDELMKTKRAAAFKKIRKEFDRYFKILFDGGDADLEEVYEEEPEAAIEGAALPAAGGEAAALSEELEKPKKKKEKILAGIEIFANPPGKKIKTLHSLSGGERTLTSLALICAVLNCNPSPFIVMDEVEAALDEANTLRFTKILSELASKSQFIIVTHNRATMHAADALYGVTMSTDGVSKLASVKLE